MPRSYNAQGGAQSSLNRPVSQLPKQIVPNVGDPNFADYFLRKSTMEARGMEEFSDRMAGRHRQNVEDLSQERRRITSGAGLAAQSKFRSPGGGSFAAQLEQTVRRGKARQGIVNRGENAIRNQQLKDRIALMRSGVTRRAQLAGASSNAQALRTGLETTRSDARSSVNQALAGAGGFIAGGALRGFGDSLFGSTPAIDPVDPVAENPIEDMWQGRY